VRERRRGDAAPDRRAAARDGYATQELRDPSRVAARQCNEPPYHSTTAQRVIFDEAVANGAIEVESGDRNSTNLVMAIPSGVAQMESKGAAVGPATAFRVVNSSLSHEPHGYPVQLGPVACRKCGAPALG